MSESILHEPSVDWFAAQVWSGREQLCATHLRLRGYDVFLPCYREHRHWSDRVKKIERPLFPGYLFCQLHGAVTGKVVTTPGIICIVGDGRRPLPISSDEIEAIQRVVRTGLAAEPWPFIQAGHRVRIGVGPLRDTEGIVLRTKNSNRLIVSITLLQRSVAVELDSDWVTVQPESLFSHGGLNR